MHSYTFPGSPVNGFGFMDSMLSIQFKYPGTDNPDKVANNGRMLIDMLIKRGAVFIR